MTRETLANLTLLTIVSLFCLGLGEITTRGSSVPHLRTLRRVHAKAAAAEFSVLAHR